MPRSLLRTALLSSALLLAPIACSPAPSPSGVEQPSPTVDVPVAPGPSSSASAPETGTASAPPAEAPCSPQFGELCGVVRFTGKVPAMVSPPKRKEADYCKDWSVPHNAVRVKDGGLADVAIYVVSGLPPVETESMIPDAAVKRRECVHEPRVLLARVGQTVMVGNEDGTLHNVHVYGPDGASAWNRAQPRRAPEIAHLLDTQGVYRVTDDVHPWEQGFFVVLPHTWAAVSDEKGAFLIDNLPPGKLGVEAWHSIYGKKRIEVTIEPGMGATAVLTFDGTERMAAENPNAAAELKSFR
ncbi:MAG: hypothetical protein R3B70_43845 [Polyangiaceae bacterium]